MFVKLVRIGRDAELRYTPSQKPVLSLACVYDIGWGDNKKPQWIDATVWGKQAESLAQYLLKGKQIVISADDLEVEEYQTKNGGTGSKLKCRVIDISLTDSGQQTPKQQAPQQQGGYQQQAPQQAPQTARQATNQAVNNNIQQGGFQQTPSISPQEPNIDFDDDIPF